VVNTSRQLGGTLGGPVAGAVLASGLASALHGRAVAAAAGLPAAVWPKFVASFSAAARAGLEVGRGQASATLPARTPPSLAPHLNRLIHEVFAGSYIEAMHWALAVPVALLVAGSLACLAMRREPGPAPTPGSAATSVAARRDAPGGPALDPAAGEPVPSALE
jgi:hypothetical protein